ncbi:MAG: PH domain-containing protein [Candidatus Nanoarchaeia archaeon]
MAEKEFKPLKKAFILIPFLKAFVIYVAIALLATLGIIARVGTPEIFILIIGIIFFLVSVFTLTHLFRRYKKEKYIFLKNKIIRKSGTFFTDSETELNLKNITQVNLNLPYIEHNIFRTGHIHIQSAGSGGIEVPLSSIEDSHGVYSEVANMMKDVGFSLEKERVVQEETPSAVGAFKDVISGVVIALFSSVVFIQAFVVGILGAEFISELQKHTAFMLIGFVAIGFFILYIILKFTFRFLDLLMRVYTIYPDTITYYEGFLTRVHSFIPVENLADVATDRTFLDRVLGLYDVKVSCQGSGQELLFKNVINGKRMEKKIYQLIKASKSLVSAFEAKKADKKETTEKSQENQKKDKLKKVMTSSHRIEPARTLLPYLLFIPILPLFIFIFPLFFVVGAMFIKSIIVVACTTYRIKEKSVEESFKFLSASQAEFSFDKVTGIVIKENFIDRMFNTFSIHFWSIGSSKNIVFKNIKKTHNLRKKILKLGSVDGNELVYSVKPDFGFKQFIMANIPFLILLTFLFLASIIGSFFTFLLIPVVIIIPLLVFLFYIYRSYYYNFCRLYFYRDYVMQEQGILFRSYYYSRYENIKGLTIKRYPSTDTGNMKFNIAGEHISGGQEGRQVPVSYSFGFAYTPGIENKKYLTDIIISDKPTSKTIQNLGKRIPEYYKETKRVSKPDIANDTTIILVFTPILLVLMPILLVFLIWKLRVTSYSIEKKRIVKRHGILYRTQTSILFEKIDHINSHQGPLNKLYSNGKVIINTTGSSSAEMVVGNIPDFREFYEELKISYIG